MLVHLPGAYRATQIFGAAYVTAPVNQQYAMELMAQAVERDLSYRLRPDEETRFALEPTRVWVQSTLSRFPLAHIRALPKSVLAFLENRKASEILLPPQQAAEISPSSSRPPLAPPPKRLPLIMWREGDLHPLLADFRPQIEGLQRLLDAAPAGDLSDPALLSAVYFYQLARRLMRTAFFDELTGLRNRHELERLTEAEFLPRLQRKKKNSPSDFFLAIDIDHFKKVNDTYGHPVGDIVLQKVAKRLFEVTRKGDYVFRVGGEEFLIFLAGAGDKGVPRVAQKIRREISELKIEVPELAKPLRVTVSIGVAHFREDPSSVKPPVDHSMDDADVALYRAKERGRNKVVYFWKK
ncbi:MAG TPA: GGDEF domain-containing protein [bacterium]|nr:GGDEF domain-containing protein [bacterium]